MAGAPRLGVGGLEVRPARCLDRLGEDPAMATYRVDRQQCPLPDPTGVRVKNLASRILGQNLARLSADWQAVHGHGLMLAETFIDPARFAGTCYRAANWIDLGPTRGFAKSNATYVAHGAPKRIWVYPLHQKARLILSQPSPHRDLPRQEVKTMILTDADAAALFARLGSLGDPRAKRGLRHSQRSLIAIILCAVISGAQGPTAIGEWVKRLPPAMLRRLRCRRTADGRYEPPSEPTIRRLLQTLDIAALEENLGDWLHARGAGDEPVALDGKTLRGSQEEGRPRQLVAALGHTSGMVLNQSPVMGPGGPGWPIGACGQCCLIARSCSRLDSRSFRAARLSCCFLPLASAISILARPTFQ